MNCSKQISIFLATLILLANLGLSLSVHYCHDEIASISLQLQEEPCVAKESSCCAKVLSHNSCCSNKIIKVVKKTDTIVVNTTQLDLEGFVVTSKWSPSKMNSDVAQTEFSFVDFYCDSHAPPLYELHCQFVFYA
jgi:hypothetical protein